MKIVEIEPDDVLVIRSKNFLSNKKEIQKLLNEIFSNKILVLDGGMKIDIIKSDKSNLMHREQFES